MLKTGIIVLILLAIAGTFVLSRALVQGDLTASVFMGGAHTYEILLYSDRAEPTEVTISTGDEVVFQILDAGQHTIAEERARRNDARLESGELKKGDSYSLTFLTKGSFSFYDRQNQDIHVTIIVE